MTADPGLPFRETAHFLRDTMGAKLLASALRKGIIDRLITGPLSEAELRRRFGIAPAGASLLIAGLQRAEVIDQQGSALRLSQRFGHMLQWLDLLWVRLEFASLVQADFTELTSELLGTGEEFMAKSQTFELFRYDRAKHRSVENRAATERWVRWLSVLSRYEAAGLLRLLEQAGARRILDLGGNSGALAHAICAEWGDCEAQVFDLPVVCDIGRTMHAAHQSAQAVSFVEGDLRGDTLPLGADLILFKSVLHDWPDRDIAAFLEKAASSLAPHGRIAIFERMPFNFAERMPGFVDLPNLMFMHALRPPALYQTMLSKLGLEIVQQTSIELDMPFALTVARKSA